MANRFTILLRALSGMGVRTPAMQLGVPKASADQSVSRGQSARQVLDDSALLTRPHISLHIPRNTSFRDWERVLLMNVRVNHRENEKALK